MSLKDDLSKMGDDQQHTKNQKSIPKGWEPSVVYDAGGGTLISLPRAVSDSDPDPEGLFADFNLNPDAWRITGLRRSKWQRWDGEWLESFRATFVPNFASNLVPIDDLLAVITKWKPKTTDRKPVEPRTDGLAYVLVLADTQIGKMDGGGSDVIIENVLSKIDAGVLRLKELRKAGRIINAIYLPQLGDCIEGFNSQGGRNAWRNDLDLTQQIRIYRRLLLHMVKTFAPLTDKLVVPCVGGNHDEAVRVGNAMATTYTDSFALDAASAIADALADHPDYKHVSFVFPKYDHLTVTLDICGTIVGMTHGHQCKGKAVTWWANQAHGQQEIGEATLLLTGHYHHLRVEQTGVKTWIQAPALDGGSTWFENATGQSAPAGMITLTVGQNGWGDLQIL